MNLESVESKIADLIGDSIPTPSWEDMIEDIKELCNHVCESEQSSYDQWMEEVGDDNFGHIYQLAERIRKYFDPTIDIPF